MSTYVMLSLDVERKASAEKRDEFYESLESKNWKKLSGVSTTWAATYKGDDIEKVTKHAMAELRGLADEAGVVFQAVMQAGNSAPTSFGAVVHVVRRA